VIADAGVAVETEGFAHAIGSPGNVLSIEANPVTFERLQARSRWNALENVIACRAALVEHRWSLYVERRLGTYERNTVNVERCASDLAEPVEGLSLDDRCATNGVGGIDFIKMNIEGAEILAIEGMTRMIRRTGAVCFACHGADARRAVVSFLSEAGFDVVTRDDDGRSYVRDHIHAIRR
jgi:FkbM family methyltransferase